MYILYHISSEVPIFKYFNISEFGMHFITDYVGGDFTFLVKHEIMMRLLIYILNINILNSVKFRMNELQNEGCHYSRS